MGKTYRPDFGKHRREPKPPKSRHHKRLEDSEIIDDEDMLNDMRNHAREDDTTWKP